MDRSTAGGVVSSRTFEDYDPAVEWSYAADADTISLPGFRKDELRVLVDSKGHLRVRGERPVEAGSSRWVRFSKDLKLPDNCDTGGVRAAKFQNEKLTITLPKKNPPSPPGDGSSAPKPAPTAREEDKSHPSPPGGSAPPEPAPPAVQEEKKCHSSPPDGSTPEPPPPTKQEEEKSRPSPTDGSSTEPAPPAVQEEKSRPSPPGGSVPEPAPTILEDDEDEDEELMMVEIEMADGRRPINWLLVVVAAASFVGIAAYVVWRKLRSGCAAGAGDHVPGDLAGAGSYIDEM